MKISLFKKGPERDRERLCQFVATVSAFGAIFGLKGMIGLNWAILCGVVTYFIVGLLVTRKVEQKAARDAAKGEEAPPS
ncbi:hypothetical protein C4J81_04775 [Deltaproteobacteria bacterium Smac51]|nr:hypothetical protein C4J81_04775 [Deltaproteobacteria bacterium Smac51]